MKATHHPPTQARPTPAELLHGAARYLQAHGWTQGQFYDLTGGNPDAFPPACAAGAVTIAAYGRCIADGIHTLDEAASPEHDDAIRALRVLADFLDGGYTPTDVCTPSSIDVIGDWNDHTGRTLDEVIDTLHAAADDWTSQHPAHPTGGIR